MIWAVLGLVPNAVAVQCAFDDLVIQKATARAGAIFSGLDLIGMSFFSLLRDKSNSSVIRRMMLVNQSMADSSRWVSVKVFRVQAARDPFYLLWFGPVLPKIFNGSPFDGSLNPTP